MALSIQLLLADGVELFETEEGRLSVRTPQGEAGIIGELPAGVRAALLQLNDTAITEEALVASTKQQVGAADLPLLYFSLSKLVQAGSLWYRAEGERGILVTAILTSSSVELHKRPVDPDGRYIFSRFACVRREQDRMVIDSPASSTQVVVHDPRVGAFVVAFSGSRRFGDLATLSHGLSEPELRVLGTLLLSCGILAETNAEGRLATEEEGALGYWDFHDLTFHARTRHGRHRMPYGITFRLADRGEPLPATKPPMSEETVELYRPDLDRLLVEDVPFTAVVEGRRSTRSFGDSPLSVRQLGEFLYRTARQRRVFKSERGDDLSSRPYPGGGAIYELEIYVNVRSCLGLTSGFYHYCPREHRLFRLASRPELVERLLRQASLVADQLPQVVLTISARFGRIFRKYDSMGYALILKDVGVLFQTMYLVAEAMDLGACAMGGGDSDLFAAAAGVDYYAESSVGELVIGSRCTTTQSPRASAK